MVRNQINEEGVEARSRTGKNLLVGAVLGAGAASFTLVPGVEPDVIGITMAGVMCATGYGYLVDRELPGQGLKALREFTFSYIPVAFLGNYALEQLQNYF
jgi:hypothetical protein